MKEFKNFVEEENSANHFSVKYEISRILYSKQSPFQKVEVAETLGHGKMLLNDDLVMITERDEFIYHDMISHVPLFTHLNPERVLVIGGGDGGTAREVLRHKSVQLCEMVEIDALVVEACREFIPQTAVGMREDSRFKLHIADGVEFIKNSDPGLYDVIIVDSTDPIGPAQPLFGSEFYQGIFRALKDDGLVVSQGESPYYNPDVQQMMAKMLSGIFPILRYYNFTNLTYPGGYWSFSFASKKYDPIKDFKPNRVDESQLKFGYYNKDIHLGAFRLPSFQLENIGSFFEMTNLPFKFQVLRSGEFVFKDKPFSSTQIIEALAPHLTEERKSRIDQVVAGRTYSVATVAEHLYDIGNISAVMRSAESFGFMPFHIVERKGARYKMSDRISRGSEKWLDIHRSESSENTFENLKSAGYKIYSTDLDADCAIEELDFSGKVALVFGNEKDGISEDAKNLSDKKFIWPMRGFAQSFNISVAAALCFSVAHRKRTELLGNSCDLTDVEKEILTAHYYLRTLDSAEAILLRL